jgi:hypothetical protein
MFVFSKNKISYSLFILFISSISLYAADTAEMSQEEIKRYFIENYLEIEYSEYNSEAFDKIMEYIVDPFLKAQAEKYHPGFELKWKLVTPEKDDPVSTDIRWASNSEEVLVPLGFLYRIVLEKQHIWFDLGALHHEITHIKRNAYKQCENLAQKAILVDNPFLNIRYYCPNRLNNYYEFRKQEERFADEGIPNHRLMLMCSYFFYKSLPPEEGGFRYPTHGERADRFKQRLDECIRTRNHNVQKFFGINPILAKIPHINFPSAPKLLGVKPNCYEAILDLIGEHQQKLDSPN